MLSQLRKQQSWYKAQLWELHQFSLVSSALFICYIGPWYTGTTRDNFEGKKVVRLEYEAYESQALAEMKKICALIRQKWSVYGIALLHRIGLDITM